MRGKLYSGHKHLARRYKNAALRLPDRIRNAEAFTPDWGDVRAYAVREKVGRGRFGDVFRGIHIPTGQACVVKVIKPIGKQVMQRLRRECGVLQAVAGHPLTSDLLDVVYHSRTSTPALVFPWMENMGRSELFDSMDEAELRFYMFRLFQALDFTHSRGVMHRDVKPGNVLYDRETGQWRLIDWGLAEYYVPGVERNTRVSTRPFKAPELQLQVGHYDYGVDIWAAGCTLASFLFDRHPFFYERGDGKAQVDPLIRHAEILGTDALEAYMTRLGLRFSPEQFKGIGHRRARVPWSEFVVQGREHLCSDDAFDLLDNLLTCAPAGRGATWQGRSPLTASLPPYLPRYDHTTRYTAIEALSHPFFDSVRADLCADMGPDAETSVLIQQTLQASRNARQPRAASELST